MTTSKKTEADDLRWMRRALALARRGWGKTSPNPMVGAVLVKNCKVVGRGWHQRAGQPHAETHALTDAGGEAAGSTLYVTLEPCSSHGRTPPCSEAIIAAGVSRVVIGHLDPNARHSGQAVDQFEAAGIEVSVGVHGQACWDLNEAFLCWIRYGRPFVLLKMAMTLDGKIATRAGASQWITGDAARAEVQQLRQWADAIMVGGETIRRDNPQLLVRTPPDWSPQPLRLIASRSGKLGEAPQVLRDGRAESRIIRCDSRDDWQAFLQRLGDEEITALLVEGGGALAGELLQAGVVDKVAFFVAPMLLGGRGSRPVVGGPDPASLSLAPRLQRLQCNRCGEDLLITGYLTDTHEGYQSCLPES